MTIDDNPSTVWASRWQFCPASVCADHVRGISARNRHSSTKQFLREEES